jgi:hypothetical protein
MALVKNTNLENCRVSKIRIPGTTDHPTGICVHPWFSVAQ